MHKLQSTSPGLPQLASVLQVALVMVLIAVTGPAMAMGQAAEVGSGPVRVGERLTVGGLVWDAHEFTVGQFRAFVKDTKTLTRAEREGGGFIYESGWEQRAGWTWQRPFGQLAGESEPAVHITFDEAEAACRWSGGRLPTDAEWTAAAYLEQRGRPPEGFEKGRRYPYPNGQSAKQSHCLGGCGAYAGLAPLGALDRGLGHVAAGTTPRGVNGLVDMGGNVWEWVNTGVGNDRITRGASWWYGPDRQSEDDVAMKPRETRVAYIGFRCVRPVAGLTSSKQ